MSKQSWRGSTLLNPEPPVLVSCGGLEQPNLITIGWTGTICTQPSMVSISVRPGQRSDQLPHPGGEPGQSGMQGHAGHPAGQP